MDQNLTFEGTRWYWWMLNVLFDNFNMLQMSFGGSVIKLIEKYRMTYRQKSNQFHITIFKALDKPAPPQAFEEQLQSKNNKISFKRLSVTKGIFVLVNYLVQHMLSVKKNIL